MSNLRHENCNKHGIKSNPLPCVEHGISKLPQRVGKSSNTEEDSELRIVPCLKMEFESSESQTSKLDQQRRIPIKNAESRIVRIHEFRNELSRMRNCLSNNDGFNATAMAHP